MPFREWNFVFREWNFEFRELLGEYPGTLPELREWPFRSESVFSGNWGGSQASDEYPGPLKDYILSGPLNRDLRQYSCDTPL